ncbi:hypothetical protein HYR99_25745 [Candidatus Poribacteria bacterium]|nr:hypothetical protein [Candidatus Poribacteria bacterium]
MNTVSDRLKWIRENKYGNRGMSRFAKQLKLSPGGYFNYERGVRQIPSDVLLQVAIHTSVNLHWLLTGEGLPYPSPESSKPLIRSKIREAIGHFPDENFSPKGEVAIEGVHHQKFLTDYWPALKAWVETEKTHLWLIDKQEQPPSFVHDFENVVYLNRSLRKDQRIIKNLRVDTVIYSLPNLSEAHIFTDWTNQTREIFMELTTSNGMVISGRPDRRKQVSTVPIQFVNPYWSSAYPFYQNANYLLGGIGGKISQVEIVFHSPDSPDESLLHALCLLALVGDLNSVEIQSVSVPQTAERGNIELEILLRLATYLETGADVSLKTGRRNANQAAQYVQLKGEPSDKQALRIDFRGGEISIREKNKPSLYLMPILAKPYSFLLNQVLSGSYSQNPCGIPFQVGTEVLRLHSEVKAQIQSESGTEGVSEGKAFAGENIASPRQRQPLVQAVLALVHALPLTEPDRDLLLDIISRQGTRLNRFQLTLHPDALKSFDSSIEAAAKGGIGNISRLVKYCLIRATIGTTAALFVPHIVLHFAEKDRQLALEYVRSIPDSLIRDKLTAYEIVMNGLLGQGKTAEARQIVEEALAIVNQQDDSFERMRRELSIARFYAHCGEMVKARQMITEAPKMLKADAANAELIVKFHRNVAALECELGDLGQAEQVLNQVLALGKEKLTDSQCMNIHLSRTSVLYAHLGLKWREQSRLSEAKKALNLAEQLIEQINDPWHQVEAITEGIMLYHRRFSDSAQAQAILERSIDIARSISDPTRQSMALSRIIVNLAHEGEVGLAVDLADQISDPMHASVALLNIAFAYIKRNHRERAQSFLTEAIQLAEKATNLHGRTEILREVGMKLINNQEIQMALKLAQRLTGSDGDKIVLLSRLVRALFERGETDSASQKLEQLIESAQQIPIPEGRLRSLIQMAMTDWIVGDPERTHRLIADADELLQASTKPGEKMIDSLQLAEFYAQSGDEQKVNQYIAQAEEIARSNRNPSDALSVVACTWAKVHHPDETLELVQQEIQEPALKAQAIAQVAINFSQSGDLKNAVELMPQVKNPISRAILCAQNAGGFAERGNMEQATAMLNEALELASHITLSSNQAKVYACIAYASAKMGSPDQALHFLQSALQQVARCTREIALEVIGDLIPVMTDLGGTQLLSDVYAELRRADEIFNG